MKEVNAGSLPIVIGEVDLSFTEMMFWLYCPISIVDSYNIILPDNLKQFIPLVTEACADFDPWRTPKWLKQHYVYLTAKTLWVSDDYIGNRPGWHIDGYGTDDTNYIWCDRAPTEFIQGSYNLSVDCDTSLNQMAELGKLHEDAGTITTFPDKTLLKLDNKVIHRSPVKFEAGMRTFVKVSISKDKYNLVGNSINHGLDFEAPMQQRGETRNHPCKDSS